MNDVQSRLDSAQRICVIFSSSLCAATCATTGEKHVSLNFSFFFFFFYFTYLPWEISVITGFHYLPANKYNGDVELHIQNNTKLNDGVMR